ncbi:MAG TPA: PEP-CTERM sorting domain-containing protein [Candidatus Sulfopaludibacter sp.]|nr:PEP-CTERM sorting domain-containing protein [Candidatus Sulfopaludibacter sp.]
MHSERRNLEDRLTAYSATSKSVAALWNWKDRLGCWPTYCAATAAALAGVTSASAGVIYSGPVNFTVSVPTSGFNTAANHVFAVPGLASASFLLGVSHRMAGAGHYGSAYMTFGRTARFFSFDRGHVYGGSLVKRLASGQVVSHIGNTTSGAFALGAAGHAPAGDWAGGNVAGFAAVNFFAFSTHSPGGSYIPHYDYGWLHIRVQDLNNDGIPDALTLIDFAYDNSGQPLAMGSVVGTVPEPATAGMMLLAAGAAGVAAWKRRRKAA